MLAPVAFMGGLATRKRNYVDTFSYSVFAKTLAGNGMRNRGSFELLPHNEKLAEQMKSYCVKYESFFKDFYDAAGFIGKEHFNAVRSFFTLLLYVMCKYLIFPESLTTGIFRGSSWSFNEPIDSLCSDGSFWEILPV